MESTQLQPQLALHAIAIKSVRGLLRERQGGAQGTTIGFCFRFAYNYGTNRVASERVGEKQKEESGRDTKRNLTKLLSCLCIKLATFLWKR